VFANFALYQAGTIDSAQMSSSDFLRIDHVDSKEECLSKMTRIGKQMATYVTPERQHIQIIRATYGANCPTPDAEVINGNTVKYNYDVTVELQAKIQNQTVPTFRATLADILSSSETSAARLVSNSDRIPDCTGAQLTVVYTCDGGDEITKTVKAGETMILDCVGQGKCYVFGSAGDLMNTLYSKQNINECDTPLISQPNLFGNNGNDPIYVYPNYTDVSSTDLTLLKSSIRELQNTATQVNDQYERQNDLLQSFEKGTFNFFNTPGTIKTSMDQVREQEEATKPENVILQNSMATLSTMVTDYSQRLKQFAQTTATNTEPSVSASVSASTASASAPTASASASGPTASSASSASFFGMFPNIVSGVTAPVDNIISKKSSQIKTYDNRETQQDKVIRILKYTAILIAIITFFTIMAYYIRSS